MGTNKLNWKKKGKCADLPCVWIYSLEDAFQLP
jgi:hypothetical protein